jgi:hypothetical protein
MTYNKDEENYMQTYICLKCGKILNQYDTKVSYKGSFVCEKCGRLLNLDFENVPIFTNPVNSSQDEEPSSSFAKYNAPLLKALIATVFIFVLIFLMAIYLSQSGFTSDEIWRVIFWVIVSVVVCWAVAYIYFYPSLLAFKKNHENRYVILILNVCLGATIVVWLLCLVWAMNLHSIKDKGKQ